MMAPAIAPARVARSTSSAASSRTRHPRRRCGRPPRAPTATTGRLRGKLAYGTVRAPAPRPCDRIAGRRPVSLDAAVRAALQLGNTSSLPRRRASGRQRSVDNPPGEAPGETVPVAGTVLRQISPTRAQRGRALPDSTWKGCRRSRARTGVAETWWLCADAALMRAQNVARDRRPAAVADRVCPVRTSRASVERRQTAFAEGRVAAERRSQLAGLAVGSVAGAGARPPPRGAKATMLTEISPSVNAAALATRENVARLGRRTSVVCADGRALPDVTVDRALVDAPCSGSASSRRGVRGIPASASSSSSCRRRPRAFARWHHPLLICTVNRDEAGRSSAPRATVPTPYAAWPQFPPPPARSSSDPAPSSFEAKLLHCPPAGPGDRVRAGRLDRWLGGSQPK